SGRPESSRLIHDDFVSTWTVCIPNARPNRSSRSVQTRASLSWLYARRTWRPSEFLRIDETPLTVEQAGVLADAQVQRAIGVWRLDLFWRDEVAARVDIHRVGAEIDLPVGPAGHVRDDPGRGV